VHRACPLWRPGGGSGSRTRERFQSDVSTRHADSTEYHDLEGAFGRRAVTERAKGILMERHSVDDPTAFETLRDHSRPSNRKLVDVASAVVDGHGLLPKAAASALLGNRTSRPGVPKWTAHGRYRNEKSSPHPVRNCAPERALSCGGSGEGCKPGGNHRAWPRGADRPRRGRARRAGNASCGLPKRLASSQRRSGRAPIRCSTAGRPEVWGRATGSRT